MVGTSNTNKSTKLLNYLLPSADAVRTTCIWNHSATGLDSIHYVVQIILKRVRLTSTKRDQSAARATVSSSVG